MLDWMSHDGRESGSLALPAAAGRAGSMLAHLSLLIGLLAASWLRVGTLPERDTPRHAPLQTVSFQAVDPGPKVEPASPAPPPPRAGRSGAGAAQPASPSVPERRPREPATREGRPEAIVQEPAPPTAGPPESDDAEAGATGSSDGPDGETGGLVGGISGGKRGGIAGGTPGGDGTGGGTGSGGPADTIYIDGTVTPPRLVTQVRPEYPAAARQARLGATVMLQIVVDRYGDVTEVTVLRSHPLFDGVAVEAIRQWKYRPAMQNGRAVKVYLLVTVEFRLR